jgi:outer membrane autotransporter protein
MNKNLYRLIWNHKLNLFQVVAELVRRRGKKNASSTSLTASNSSLIASFCKWSAALLIAVLSPVSGSAESIRINTYGTDGADGVDGENGGNGEWAALRLSGGNGPRNGGGGQTGSAGANGEHGWSQVFSDIKSLTISAVTQGGDGGRGGAGGMAGSGGSWGMLGLFPNPESWHSSGGTGGNGGAGGNGGNGVAIGASSMTLKNFGIIRGGAGGEGGAFGKGARGGGNSGDENWRSLAPDGIRGENGSGGYGIYIDAGNSHIINAGLIEAGANQEVAIKYSSSVSDAILELHKDSIINGIVDASEAQGVKHLILGTADAADNGVFDVSSIGHQYLGFNSFKKTGAGTWELTGSLETGQADWLIDDGVLRVSSADVFGTDSYYLEFDSGENHHGRLDVTESMEMTRRIIFKGTGGGINVAAGKVLSIDHAMLGDGTLDIGGEGELRFMKDVEDDSYSRRIGGMTLQSGVASFDPGVQFKLSHAYTQTGGILRLDMDGSNVGEIQDYVIQAQSASLGGGLEVNNYTLAEVPAIASDLASRDRIVIATTDGISGDFSSAPENLEVVGYDFLRMHGRVHENGRDYVLRAGLAWDAANDAHGIFNIVEGTEFTVDHALGARVDGGDDLLKNGAGILRLSAQNTYAGATTVEGGTLALNGAGDISRSAEISLADGATLDVADLWSAQSQINNLSGAEGSALVLGATALTVNVEADAERDFAGQIRGSGDVIKSGDGNWRLSGDNSGHSGTVHVMGGSLSAGVVDVLSDSRGLSVAQNATFLLSNLDQQIAWISSGITGGTIDLGSATLTLSGANAGLNTASFSGSIIGTGDLVKSGSYTQYLSGSEVFGYNGTTFINEGVLALRDVSATDLMQQITLNGGWLDLSDSPDIGDWSDLVITADGAAGTGGVIGAGDVVHLQPGQFNAAIGLNDEDDEAHDGVYVIKDTEGETLLSGGGNTYVGNTRIQAGILTVSADALLGNTELSREVVLAGGTLRVDGSFDSARALVLESDGMVDVVDGNTTTLRGGITGTDGTSQHGLTKSGAGTLILTGVSDYSGATTIAQGTLVLEDNADLRGSALVFSADADGAVFDVSALAEATAYIGELIDDGINSIIALGNTSLYVGGGGDFNGVIQDQARSGEAGGALLKYGDNELTLNGINTYTGATTIAGGVLALSDVGSVAASSSLSLVAAGAILDISASADAVTVNNLSGVRNSMIMLGEQNLEVQQDQDTTYAGDLQGSGSLTKSGDGALILAGETAYSGDTVVMAGTLILDGVLGAAQLISDVYGSAGAALVLQRGAVLTGRIDPLDLSVKARSTWNMTDDSIVNNMTLAGITQFIAPALPLTTGRTLTAQNWEGQGGTVGLYTVLNGSDSASDQLIIDGGSAIGSTSLRILNAGGLGAVTEGDGIRVVATINGATTDTEAFTLAQRVTAGAYDYTLTRGGEMTEDDWFLVSSYRSETSLYGALGNQGLRYGEVVLGSLQERMGALEELAAKGNAHAWGRLYGAQLDQGGSDRMIGRSEEMAGFQTGSDIYVRHASGNRDSLGWYMAIGTSDARVEHRDASGQSDYAGHNRLNGYSLGAYATRMNQNGLYLDLVGQVSRYNWKSHSADGLQASPGGYGAAGSIEIGNAFDLGDGYRIEPQAQMIAQMVNLERFTIEDMTVIDAGSSKSLTARLGVRWSRTQRYQEQISTGWHWICSARMARMAVRCFLPKEVIQMSSLPTRCQASVLNSVPV